MASKYSNSPAPSPAVLAAQAHLAKLRALHIAEAASAAQPMPVRLPNPGVDYLLKNAQQELLHQRQRLEATATTSERQKLPVQIAAQIPTPPNTSDKPATNTPITNETVTVHPSILLAMLKQNQESPGRIYLLLRHLDQQGRGWLPVAQIRQALTHKDSKLRICGWRRLRQLFQQGMGIYWQRENRTNGDRIWLTGAHRIAHILGCERLTGTALDLPLKTLLGGIQTVRAHFYAAFHSGRKDNPVSRQKLHEITGVPARTQRAYDELAHVKRQHNIAVGPRYSQQVMEEQAWQRGGGSFHFLDTQGRQGRRNGAYVAWHLPNSYAGPHDQRSKNGRKRLNRKLADLLNKGTTGNSGHTVVRLFWPHGAVNWSQTRLSEQDAYWHNEQTSSKPTTLWHVFMRRQA